MIPISRPRIVSDGADAYFIFRDMERGGKVSVAHTPEIGRKGWTISDVTDFPVEAWEPSLDINLWNCDSRLDIFVQTSYQGDGEKVAESAPESTPVYILSL